MPVLGGSAAPPPPAAGYRPPPPRGAGVPPPRPFTALTLRSPRALLSGPGRAPWPRPVLPLGPRSPGVRTAEGPGRADPGSPLHVGGGRFPPFSGPGLIRAPPPPCPVLLKSAGATCRWERGWARFRGRGSCPPGGPSRGVASPSISRDGTHRYRLPCPSPPLLHLAFTTTPEPFPTVPGARLGVFGRGQPNPGVGGTKPRPSHPRCLFLAAVAPEHLPWGRG